ncbi:Aconitate hydratase [Fulvivirga imtechensis AK7]|uniref:Aconitate hydratase n=1 Tax=Fulvivirga imtechensis AK7 TaxID=1237149 RepID=L8JSR6_9BACT|nr:aconitate hydratase [Fulvivirga imtechensis]ELR71895.1 Aconitate hydratase [Fulvivirga imtechensis AK7]
MNNSLNVTQKLISSHLLSGEMVSGSEIGLKIDQTLTQDATGTMVMLELEAMGIETAKTELSVQYVDHNLIQADYRNADDHIFLKSAAQRFGLWYSRPGNGVSHPVHMERFGVPGKTLVGSDSHTPAAGGMGMLAIGAGGLDVAFAIAGEPLYIKMPQILGVKLTGQLPDWVSAKDVVLEMLRRYDVKGCRGMIIEYYGPGLKSLSAMDRHVIANMGTEMGATTTVFPSDDAIKRFLRSQEREDDWKEIVPDPEAHYDLTDEVDLSDLEPMIACPSSPGNVVRVKDVAGKPIAQAVVGSSANPGIRDFWVVGEILKEKNVHPDVSLDINPTSRQVVQNLIDTSSFPSLFRSGARFHQAGCMGCIGMGQAPASGKISLRTVPRNFPGRSGTLDDQVYLCSPETAAASALTGKITDPRDLQELYNMEYPRYKYPEREIVNKDMLLAPPKDGRGISLEKGKNIKTFPEFSSLENSRRVPVILKMGDNISTDEILKAGVKVLALRSNIPEISRWAYAVIDENFYDHAKEAQDKFGGHIVVAGENYAQGSSREHAAIAPKYLGQVAVLAKSYARLGWQNLINFGIIPFEFANADDYDHIATGDVMRLDNLVDSFKNNEKHYAVNETKGLTCELKHSLSERQVKMILVGGVINHFRKQ